MNTTDMHLLAIKEIAKQTNISEKEVEWFQIANYYADKLKIKQLKKVNCQCKENRSMCSIRDNYGCMGCALKKAAHVHKSGSNLR